MTDHFNIMTKVSLSFQYEFTYLTLNLFWNIMLISCVNWCHYEFSSITIKSSRRKDVYSCRSSVPTPNQYAAIKICLRDPLFQNYKKKMSSTSTVALTIMLVFFQVWTDNSLVYQSKKGSTFSSKYEYWSNALMLFNLVHSI